MPAPTTSFRSSLPNWLTIGRIVLIPLIIWGILSLDNPNGILIGRPWFVLGLFILAAITDFLDGFLARHWQVTSDFGRMIDPIADKLLVAGCLIAISIATQGYWIILIPALIIIARDILVAGAREHAALKGRAMPPTNLAKYKTAFEMLSIACLVCWLASKAWVPIDTVIPTFLTGSYFIGLTLLWLAALLSAYTGSLYFKAALN